MNYCALFTGHHVALIHDWIAATGGVLVRIEHPHSGGSGITHTVSSLGELRALVTELRHPECDLFVFKDTSIDEEDLHKFLDRDWVYRNAEQVIYVGVHKNRNCYDAYDREPSKYDRGIDDWGGMD